MKHRYIIRRLFLRIRYSSNLYILNIEPIGGLQFDVILNLHHLIRILEEGSDMIIF